MFYYVSCHAAFIGDGTQEKPFRRIQDAADIARPGDEIIVAPGIYREYVNPKHSGTEENPIIYRAAEKGKSIISGAEPVKSWINVSDNIWLAKIPNGIFGDYNPYKTVLSGDWYYTEVDLHTGEVYLNGKSMYEASELNDVINPPVFLPSEDKDFSIYRWYTCQEDNKTLIYANFHGKNPNEENVVINVRRNCFYPSETGKNYINVSGFTIRQAATTWAPPTAYQEGMIGPHWSKGWIIEDCNIHDSKCVGISIGKYLQPNNDNKWTRNRLKQGTQTERESICQAQIEGWTKENIGSHIIRRCNIYNCEQAGIVGNLGCIFSIIEDNHIHHINNKRQLIGAEIAGVKLHAAIDLTFKRNHVHHCTRGLWLDWQAQGTSVTQNLFHDNFPQLGEHSFSTPLDIGEDLFIEVSHGPTLIDNNILLSPQACRLSAQGTAFVHNLICGSFTSVGDGTNNVGGVETVGTSEDICDLGPRYTPYHVPHRTEIAGFMTILHGDNRFYNNLFVQIDKPGAYDSVYDSLPIEPLNSHVGTFPFDDYPTEEEYLKKFFKEGDKGVHEDRSKYYNKLPVYTGGNVFFNGAKPCTKENNYICVKDKKIYVKLKIEGEKYYLDTNIFENIPVFETPFISTENLGEAFEPEQKFENPDGNQILFNQDYFGFYRGINPLSGPFETKGALKNSINHKG